MAMAALNKPKNDIREAMNDGDPTGRNLLVAQAQPPF